MRIIHTADWQLGKPFGRFEPEVRAALGEARFDAVDAIGKAAIAQNAVHVVVAGDIFDSEGPEDRVIVQALSRMGAYPCRWWLLPGNHDFARSGGLWDRVRLRAPASVTVLDRPEPREMETGVWLLPAPLVHRHHSEDPTHGFEAMATPGARLRIGLAHGSIRDFGARGEAPNLIAPDRAKLSGLDYLALGDWHGVLKIDDLTWYAGTPESDRFARDEPGQALMVELAPGASPVVTPFRTGRFHWLAREWQVNDANAFAAHYEGLLGEIDAPATLLRLTLVGIASLADRVTVLERLEHDLRHRLRHLDVRADELVGRPTEADMATLAVEGMLGLAARKLGLIVAGDGPEAAVARRALERLFVAHQRG